MPKYPNVRVRFTGRDGNSLLILGLCNRAAKEAGLSEEERQRFMNEAASGNYKHLLATAAELFDVH